MRDITGFDSLDECVEKGRRTGRYRCGNLPLRGIQPGDILTVEEAGWNGIRHGDLVLGCDSASRPGMFQVIGKRRIEGKEFLIVRGEYTLYFDDSIALNDCAGRVVSIEREREALSFTTGARSAARYGAAVLLGAKRAAAAAIRVFQRLPFYPALAKNFFPLKYVTFRGAAEDDIPALCGLFAGHCWPMSGTQVRERMEHFFRVPGRRWFIAVTQGRVVGMINADDTVARDGGKAWFMDMIFVPLQYRKLRIGTRLVHYALSQGVREGVREFRGIGTPAHKKQMETLKKDGCISLDITPEPAVSAPGRPPRFEYVMTVLRPEALDWSDRT